MPVTSSAKMQIKRQFDRNRCRHYVNDTMTVLHCHHFTTLYSQLADDAELFDGKTIMRDSAEHSFRKVLGDYYLKNNITDLNDKIAIAEQYWAFVGMGQLKITKAGEISGRAEMLRSHIDEGWIKKFGTRERPVNFITQGYLSAVFSLLFDTAEKSYETVETQSIVSGSDKSLFTIHLK